MANQSLIVGHEVRDGLDIAKLHAAAGNFVLFDHQLPASEVRSEGGIGIGERFLVWRTGVKRGGCLEGGQDGNCEAVQRDAFSALLDIFDDGDIAGRPVGCNGLADDDVVIVILLIRNNVDRMMARWPEQSILEGPAITRRRGREAG